MSLSLTDETFTDDHPGMARLTRLAAVSVHASENKGDLYEYVSTHVGSIGLGEIAGIPGTILRRDDSGPCSGMVELTLQTSGRCYVRQDGREASLVPGDFAVVDTRLPYQLTFDTRFTCLVVAVTPQLLPLKPCALKSMTALRVPGHDGIGRLAAQFLKNIAQQATEQDLRNNHELASAVVSIVTAALTNQLDECSGETPAAHRASLLPRVKAYAEARLDDPHLNPADIARAQHISLRYLQKLFEAEGTTVSDWVRRHRLEHCRVDLVDPKNDAMSIAVIAARWGFLDSSYFSRIFKSTYGSTPREFRMAR
ncbi:helix-turn-helix domain-containing protein [Rhodococcus sp. WY5]|uniref:helix-turn-helix domain-containing protein n=1 Tax=Rhodococcus sp. WY5 TaxID=2708349 RepID=UPI001BDDDDE2|nr:helix-turn-helix domain-containing protein [Rhodococcus sp. WY5]